jgi:hypothetical protein
MSISVTRSPLRTTVIFWPRQVIVKRFHSPGFLTTLFVGARCPKIAPQCQVACCLAHSSAKSSAIWISTEFGIQSLVSEA